MDEILQQLGGLVLGSVPTMVFFVLLVMAYGVLVRQPLARVLSERHARTEGAVEQARAAMGAAEAETAVYEDKLRAAKTQIYQARDKRRQELAARRDEALGQVRTAAQARIQGAREEIAANGETVRQQIEASSGELSTRILKAVLPAGVEAAQ